jgi:hypothetical protein
MLYTCWIRVKDNEVISTKICPEHRFPVGKDWIRYASNVDGSFDIKCGDFLGFKRGEIICISVGKGKGKSIIAEDLGDVTDKVKEEMLKDTPYDKEKIKSPIDWDAHKKFFKGK